MTYTYFLQMHVLLPSIYFVGGVVTYFTIYIQERRFIRGVTDEEWEREQWRVSPAYIAVTIGLLWFMLFPLIDVLLQPIKEWQQNKAQVRDRLRKLSLVRASKANGT